MKLLCKILSVFLSVLLVLQIAPMQTIADAYHEATIDENTENTLGVSLDDIDTTEPEAEILAEETSKREQYVKHFRMSDGSYRATQYEVPVHFIQDGEWTDYDNTLVEVDANTEDGEDASNKDLKNTLADYSVRLSKKTNGKKFVRIEKDGYKLSWYYIKANKVTAKIIEITDDGDETTLEKLSSQVIYENVYTNTDFEYIVGTEGLKENIILNSKDTQTVFEAEYKANGLTPVQIDDKTIELRADDGTVIYTINAPYMTDANGEYSNGITLTLSSVKNNKFTVTTTLDEDWLNDYDRTYPVTVDPVIQTEQIAADMASAFVGSAYPTRNYYTYGQANGGIDSGSMYVGNISGYGQTESYLKFANLPTLGVADKVINAVGSVYMYKCENGMQVDIKRITSSWATNTVTWKTKPTVASTITDYKYISAGVNNIAFTFEITDLVRGWYSGEYANYGVSFSTTKTASAKVWMLNSLFNEGGREDARPILYVDYRNMSGYEDYWSYTGVSAGRSGALSVNNFNGNAVFSQPITADAGGSLMPVSLSLVYNSNGKTAPYTRLGGGMQSNFHIYLTKDSKLFNEGYRYYLTDSDGTKHWFYYEDSTTMSGKDEDGLGYTLDVIDLGSDTNCTNARFRLTDKNKTKMYFNNTGKLIQITDTHNTSIFITYETISEKVRIKNIKDGAGRIYTFNYEYSTDVTICTSITDPSGRQVTFTYSGEYLSKITFPDGEFISLSYSGGLLTQVNAVDGTRAKITYDSTSQKRVKSINWGTSDTNLLESYSFAYKQNETKITDKQSREYTYQFNDLGQTTGIVSNEDGQAQYFDYAQTESVTDSRANKLISQSKVLHSVTNYIIDPGFHSNPLNSAYTTAINDKTNASISVDTTKGNLTDNSVKIHKPSTNTGYMYLYQKVQNLSAGEYTLSAYFNTEGQTISQAGIYFGYLLYDSSGTKIGEYRAEKIYKTDGWERYSLSFTLQEGQFIKFSIGMQGANTTQTYGTFWVDDIQLEKSSGMSSYNLLENSAFTNGQEHWSSSATLNTLTATELPGFTKAISKVGSPTSQWLGLSQYIYEGGNKDDVFSIGAWIKADSAPINDLKKDDTYSPRFALALHFYNSAGTCIGTEEIKINDDLNSWQFVSGKVIAPVNYAKICFEVIYYCNVNTVMMTGGFCFKEEFGQTYAYDKDGNVISSVDLANSKSSFAFKGDQMAKMLNPSGSEYFYSYENDTNNLNDAVSTDGQRYSFTYDDKGNVLTSKIEADKPAQTIEVGKHYVIRNAESGNVLDNGQSVGKVHNWRYRKGNTNQIWLVESTGENGVYYLKSIKNDGFYLAVENNSNTNNASMISTSTTPSGNAFRFKIQSNGDGTFTILTKTSNYTKCVDGQPNNSKDYSDKVKILQCTKNTNDDSQRWYFYPDITSASGAEQQEYISTSATYTENKNFVATQTDQRGNETTYNYNENKGTLTSVTDASNNTTSYVYDANNNALQSVTSGGMTNSYTYSDDRLTDINVNGGTRYQFTYDSFGRTTYTKVGNGLAYRNLSQLVYNGNGLLTRQNYGNGDYITFSYDTLDRLIGKSYNGSSTDRVEYFYGADGNISKTIDYSTNTRTKYVYDLAGRLVSARDYKNGYSDHAGLKGYVEYTYADKTNYLTGVKHYNALGTQNIGYRYGDLANGEMPDQIYGVSWNGDEKVNYTYDSLGRLVDKEVILSESEESQLNTTYSYVDVDDTKTTTLLSSITTTNLIYNELIPELNFLTYNYEYDELGNITSIDFFGFETTYEYDELNQLVRENDEKSDVTYTYEYVNGNIKYKHQYAYTTGTLPATPQKTTEYHYEDDTWSDVLTKITETNYSSNNASTYSLRGNTSTNPLADFLFGDNCNTVDLTENAVINVGAIHESPARASTYSLNSNSTEIATIQSDTIGNITNIGDATLTWNGRRLESIGQGGIELVTYDYNMDGQRVKKTAPDLTTGELVTTEYFYNGDILAGQKKGNDVLIFMYDNNGDTFGFTYNGTPYYYVKNAQNDVVMIVDETNHIVVYYEYDAWGKVIYCNDTSGFDLASINPIMYRSYYVDLETGLFVYYLNSRYYIADWGRFASADSYVQTGQGMLDKNMFAYCANNPVKYCDVTGESFGFVILFTAAIVTVAKAVVTVAANHLDNYLSKKSIEKEIKSNYTQEEAKTEIDNILNNYSREKASVSAKFDSTGVEITNSYLVNSKYDRQKVSMIISRTEDFTARQYDNLSAEWYYHNIMYDLSISDSISESAQHAYLEFEGDSRKIKVGLPTILFEAIGWD